MSELLKSVLIANRGEIALRIVRACRELGIRSVLAYSEADADSLPVAFADEAVCIGPALAKLSYRDPRSLIGAAQAFKAQAIHPGYGFLSENAEFAEMCEREGLIFVGPSGDVIRKMGDKIEAKRIARAAGVPTVPGSLGAIAEPAEALAVAREVGFPLLIKAAAGGGGRGMRVVRTLDTLERDLAEVMSEAEVAFGDPAVYIERYLTDIRHIEMQVIADGDVTLHLGERDCTAQRRNQKLIEEAPSPVLDADLRQALADASVALCEAVGYRNAGTVEFVFDNVERRFYFIEMNTRIQVEHPVTILNLFKKLQRERGLTYMFISHDLNVVRYMCDRVAVMYLGKVVEVGPTEDVFANPRHPYTQALRASMPGAAGANRLQGELPSAEQPPPGCRFQTRCPRVRPLCSEREPLLVPGAARSAACHFPVESSSPIAELHA